MQLSRALHNPLPPLLQHIRNPFEITGRRTEPAHDIVADVDDELREAS